MYFVYFFRTNATLVYYFIMPTYDNKSVDERDIDLPSINDLKTSIEKELPGLKVVTSKLRKRVATSTKKDDKEVQILLFYYILNYYV